LRFNQKVSLRRNYKKEKSLISVILVIILVLGLYHHVCGRREVPIPYVRFREDGMVDIPLINPDDSSVQHEGE